MPSRDAAAAFIIKWRASTLKERSAAQEHFIDLCRLLGVKTPAEEDPHGAWFTFEKGAKKTGSGDGWADVWRRHSAHPDESLQPAPCLAGQCPSRSG